MAAGGSPLGKRRKAIETYLHDCCAGIVSGTVLLTRPRPHGTATSGHVSRHLAGPRRLLTVKSPRLLKANGLVLVTLNTKDFARFKEVEVEDWSKRKQR